MKRIHALSNELRKFEESAEGAGYEFRLDLSALVLNGLRDKGWTKAQLADAINRKPPFVTRITQSASNSTFDTAGLILFALGIKARLVKVDEIQSLPGLIVSASVAQPPAPNVLAVTY